MTRVVLVRHGESTGNAGIPTHDLSTLALTETGRRQAEALAAGWQTVPTLIATSPYLRTHLTALPTFARFPDVERAVLPMEEFTYLEPSRWNGTSRTERLPHIESYWAAADPLYRDGPGAESFAGLLARVQITLDRLAALAPDAHVIAFSHGQFMQAVRIRLMHPGWSDAQLMKHFWPFHHQFPILNADCLALVKQGDAAWELDGDAASAKA